MGHQSETRIIAAETLDLRVTDAPWDFAVEHEAEIAAHWARRSLENPRYFNGVILLLSDYRVSGQGVFSGRFTKTDFQSFLYWREHGWPDQAVHDTVGTALIRSREGHVLLCQQRPGHLNDGLSTPPGGFIDARDIGPDGSIDLARAVLREIAEETGLGPPTLRQGAGYTIAVAGVLVSIAVPWHSDRSGPELVRAASRHIAGESDGELARVLALSPTDALETLALPDYARALLGASDVLKTSA